MIKNIMFILKNIHIYVFQLQTGERDHQEGTIHDGRMYRTLSGTYSLEGWVAKLEGWVAKSEGWVAKSVARQLATAVLWVRIQTSLKNHKWAT